MSTAMRKTTGSPSIEIFPEVSVSPGATRFDFRVSYSDGRGFSVFYEVAGLEGTVPGNFDGILCALVMPAMRSGRGLRLRGPATRTALLNLREYQLAWSRWLPALYRPVEIEADIVIDDPVRCKRGAISAFSGGVDATFTLFNHMPAAPGLHRSLSACLLVHGFDIPLAASAAFATVLDRARRLHERLGVETLWVRTNSKELRLHDWEHSFAAQLAACLHLFSPRFSQALIGSSEPYDAMVLPWGSNPVTDHLLSGGEIQMVHDGAGFSRTEKLAILAAYPAAIDELRVCWAGPDPDRNCGVCEKCVRTRLNLLAVGVDSPSCFSQPLRLSDIDRMAIRNETQLAEIRSILEYSERNGIRGDWVPRLRARVAKGVRQSRSGQLKHALRAVGLLDPVLMMRKRFRR
jgi:hypothetical protein